MTTAAMPTPSSADNNNDLGTQSQSQSPPPAKRRRIGYACDLCRIKKNRCDGERPTCGPCRERDRECVYSPQRTRISVTQEYVDSLKTRNQVLEQELAAQRNRNPQTNYNACRQEGTSAVSDAIFTPREKSFQQPFPSLSRPPQHPQSFERHSSLLNHGQTLHPKGNDGSSSAEYFGESSTFDFIAKVGSPNTTAPAPSTRTSGLPGQGITAPALHAESLASISPSTVVFEDLLGSGGGSDPFELPQRSLADRLVDSYFKYRHPLNTYLHEGTFRQRYSRLWLSQDLGGEEATQEILAWLGLVNLVFAFGSEHVHIQISAIGRSPSNAVDRSRFFKRAKTLVFSGILQAGKIELVQALLLMSHYLHGSLELNNCWTVVGLAIRTAQELGLYLDPANFTTDLIEQEIRKRVWWGCFVIDRILSLKVGRPPTIHDTPAIRAGLPLAVDDEYLDEQSGYSQPASIPSKLEFFNQIVAQCRLLEKVLDTLYTGGNAAGEAKLRMKTDLPKLLALSIQLDGELGTWQDCLPQHLRPGSSALEWHFERQRNVLLMRFLHTQLLIHRQTLLFYITRRIPDAFQLDLIRPCIKRCVMAAYESITQMRLLRQHNLLSSFWHNSHYVFAALGVLLVYQKMGPSSHNEIGIPSSLDMDDVIAQGLQNLQRVGGEMHPLASRYVQSFKQLQARLRSIPHLRANAPRRPMTRPASTSGWKPTLPEDRTSTVNETVAPQIQRGSHNVDPSTGEVIGPVDTEPPEYEDGSFMMAEFDDEFAILESVLLDNGEWTGFIDDCDQT